jgi:hypothetical protein
MTLTQQIQKEFNDELLLSSQIADMVIQDNPNKIYLELEEYGFNHITNLSDAKTIETKNKNVSLVKEYKRFLVEREMVSDKKLITFAKLHGILKKYNLYMGTISGYIKELPRKNAEEVLNYLKQITNKKYPYDERNIWKRPYTYLSFPTSPEKHPYSFLLDKEHYKSFNPEIYKHGMNRMLIKDSIHLFICAPLDSFKKENRFCFENQVFWNSDLKFNLNPLEIPNPDPIILSPIGHPNNSDITKLGLFEIVTAWDRESMDSEIFNVKNN